MSDKAADNLHAFDFRKWREELENAGILAMSDLGQPDLGVELVELLRANTRLNYDVCALNLADVFQLLGSRLPSFSSTAQDLVDSIKVAKYVHSATIGMLLKIEISCRSRSDSLSPIRT